MTSLDYVRALSEDIGPRGSTSEAEARSAAFVAQQLQDMGYTVKTEAFLGAQSSYAPFALATALVLLSLVLLWQSQPVGPAAAAILDGAVLGALIFELLFRPNLLRWVLPVEDSQNVVARAAPAGDDGDGAASALGAQKVIITAHLDTHRTPLVFSSPAWLKIFRLLLPAGLVSVAAIFVLAIAGVFVTAPALRLAALVPGVVVLVVFVLMLQADRTPYTPGANDNASGVAAALVLAQRLKDRPLRRTEVVLVFTGCEEVGCYGADAFFTAHAAELRGAMHLAVDQVGAAGASPAIVQSERFLAPARSDPGLLAVADRAAARHLDWTIARPDLNTAYGELSVGVRHGLRALAFGSCAPGGASPHWHQAGDVMANLDASVLERSQELIWDVLQEIDGAREPVEGGAVRPQ